jgi:exonuclease III
MAFLVWPKVYIVKMFRFATWNVGHAVHSRQPFEQQWDWFTDNVGADVVVLTEAKPDYSQCGDGWSFVHKEGGIGGRRRWGTSIGAYDLTLRDVTNGVPGKGGFSIEHHYPGYVTIADLVDEEDGSPLITIVGVHAPLLDRNGNKLKWGGESVDVILEDLEGLIHSERGEMLIIAGDLNVHPAHIPPALYENFIDVVEASASSREPLIGCVNCGMGDECGHLWTHRNGNSPNAAVQNIDYVFISEALGEIVVGVGGGDETFPEIWEYSDHSPVMVEFGEDE